MHYFLLALASFLLVFTGQPIAVSPPPTGDPNCHGDACLTIYDVSYGTRCGTHDSVAADISNDSGSQYLRGYVIFDTPQGKMYSETNLMKPGQKRVGEQYVCHGSGTPTGIANTGPDPDHVNYPQRN